MKNIAIVASCLLSFFAFLTINPMPFYNGQAFAGPGTATLSDSTITLASASNITSVNLIPDSGFKLSESNDTASYDVITNNFSGYTITLLAADDNRTLVNTVDDNMVINSITSPILQTDFVMSDATLRNRWGIKPNKYYSAGSTITNTTTILPGPTSSGTVLDVTNAANSSAARYDVALGVMVDGTLPAGTYTRVTTLAVVPNPIHYAITYDKNTDDAVTNIPAVQSASTTETSIVISSDIPLRNHYTFSGWCLGTITTTDNIDSCSGTIFQPGDVFGIDQTTANITTLYAMWRIESVTVELTAGTGIDNVAITGTGVKSGGESGSATSAEVYYNGEITITATPSAGYAFTNWTGDATYTNNPETIANVASDLELTANAEQVDIMQNLDPSLCTTSATSLVDIRDNQSYTIQRLADGQCWMATSLNLAGGTKLYSETSDVPAGYSEFSEIPYYTLPDGNGYAGKFASDTVDYVYNTGNITTSQAGCTSTQPCNSYYSWLAATAGGKDFNGNAVTGNGLDAAYSICPKGWRLPKSGNSSDSSATSATGYKKGDFYKLITAYGANLESNYYEYSATFYNNAGPNTVPNFLRAGYYGNGSFLYGNSYGPYWSSSSASSTNAYYLSFDNSYISSADNYGYRYGYPVRCILDETPVMQNISSNTLNVLVSNTGDSTTLKDIRDNQKYTVTKLADGNVWMTQNLRFTGTNLTPTDSNVENDTTMIYGDLASGNTFDEARIHVGDNSNYGVWYNYAAASAGTITGSSNTNEATSSICPAGWRLPSSTEIDGVTSYYSHYSPVIGGGYYDGTIRYASNYGFWWSSTPVNSNLQSRYNLRWDGTNLIIEQNSMTRQAGFYVRCIYDAPAVYMQDFSNADAGSMATNDLRTLTDNRDDQTYKVAKLADGNIWMIDNLNLNSSTITASQLDSTNTNLDANETLSVDTFKSWQTSSPTATYTSGQYLPVAGTDSTSKTKNGTLYNYCAASAGAACNFTTSNTTSDICPKGWRLPIGGSNGDFQKLYSLTDYNTLTKMRSPISDGGAAFALPGYFNTSLISSGTAYWTSVAYNSTASYAMSINTSNGVNPTNYGVNSLGFSVRCIYDQNSNVMQNISQNTLNSLVPNSGDSTVLKDSRDGKKYTVSRLSDGNIWMTQNLRFTGTELTPADSNVDSNITMSYGDLTSGDSFDQARIHDEDNSTRGVIYNYAAASAGTVTGSSNTMEATQSVCPAGWRLPTRTELSNTISSLNTFAPLKSGYYANGNHYDLSGIWWTSTASDDDSRYILNYNGSTAVMQENTDGRGDGFTVRCIYDKTLNMQNINYDTLNSLVPATGNSAILKDSRDGKRYTVTRLADGNVWMTQNLRFMETELTPADSNVTSNVTMSYGDLTSGNTYDEARIHVSDNLDYGIYYNYAAASAMSITGNNNPNTATQDICPAGWRLPTNSEQTGINNNSASTYSPVTGGLYSGGVLGSNSYGYWWASTSNNNATNRYYTRWNGSSLVLYNNMLRSYGLYIRCIYNKANTMQTFSAADAAAMSVGETRILTDARDNQDYTVTKVPNNTVWMTRNLAIGCNGSGSTYGSGYASKTLTSADSNVATNWSTPTAGLNNTANYSSTPYMNCDANYGAFYNFAAASAGTITGNSNTNTAVYSICPKGWRIATSTESQAIVNYAPSMSPVAGGEWQSGQKKDQGRGLWWTATASTAASRHNLNWYTGHTTFGFASGMDRTIYGGYIRCIAE